MSFLTFQLFDFGFFLLCKPGCVPQTIHHSGQFLLQRKLQFIINFILISYSSHLISMNLIQLLAFILPHIPINSNLIDIFLKRLNLLIQFYNFLLQTGFVAKLVFKLRLPALNFVLVFFNQPFLLNQLITDRTDLLSLSLELKKRLN